jgi:NAD-dependent dihydropyrimidine dehydrogenase PreA subunit/flavodoxin
LIFYFSATGNSKHVAERIATALGDSVISISECVDNSRYEFELSNTEKVGIISPTYNWGLPTIVNDFLRQLSLKNAEYLYFVATYGTTTGQTGTFVRKHMENKGLKLDASFSVKMPDVWTPVFNLTDEEKLKRINASAEVQIDEIIQQLKENKTGNFMHNKVPMLAVNIYYRSYDSKRKTNNFTVEDTCIGCGLCEKKCPAHAIQLKDKRPVWIKDKCIMCLGCLHRCPTYAIQYGKNTKKHGQYQHPFTKV